MTAETYDVFEYKDISELKKELESIKGRKEVSNKELYEAVQKLAQVMGGIVEVFGAAAEQMNLEEKEFESTSKKHEIIITKLDKMIMQNKTIAEGMVAVVDMIKEKLGAPSKEKEDDTMLKQKDNEDQFFKPKVEAKTPDEPNFFMMNAPQHDWTPKPMQAMPGAEQMMAKTQQTMPPPMYPMNFGMQMPPMEPAPPPPDLDLDFGEELSSLGEEPKKKSLFGIFKK